MQWFVCLGYQVMDDAVEHFGTKRLLAKWVAIGGDVCKNAAAVTSAQRNIGRAALGLRRFAAGIARDVGLTGSPSMAAFMGARTAELDDGPSGYEAERMRQAEWLAEALHLKH